MNLDNMNMMEVYNYYKETKNRQESKQIWEYLVYNYPNYFK